MRTFRFITFMLLGVSGVLFGAQEYASYADARYFQEHKKQLTHEEKVVDADGNRGANFIYENTPYHIYVTIFLYAFILIPPVLLLLFSMWYILHSSSPKRLQHSFVLLLIFCVWTIILHIPRFLNPHTGWDEQVFGALFLSVYCIAVAIPASMGNILAYQKTVKK